MNNNDQEGFIPKSALDLAIAVIQELQNPDFAWKCPDEDYLQLIDYETKELSSGMVLCGAFRLINGSVVGYAFDILPFFDMLNEYTDAVGEEEKDGKMLNYIDIEQVPVLTKKRDKFSVTNQEKLF